MRNLRNKELTLIITDILSGEMEEELSTIIENFIDRNLDRYNFIGSETEDKEYSVLSLDSSKVEMLKNAMSNLGIKFKSRNITDDVLIGNFDDDIKIVYNDSEYNRIFIQDFIRLNLTVDDVLDKINRFGYDSLNETDKEVLSRGI